MKKDNTIYQPETEKWLYDSVCIYTDYTKCKYLQNASKKKGYCSRYKDFVTILTNPVRLPICTNENKNEK